MGVAMEIDNDLEIESQPMEDVVEAVPENEEMAAGEDSEANEDIVEAMEVEEVVRERPMNLDESSILEPTPNDVTCSDVPTYEIIKEASIRGQSKLFDSRGYSYTVKRKTSSGTAWRCSFRSKTTNCPATVRQMGDEFLPGPQEHSHSPNVGAATAASVSVAVKSKAAANPFMSAGDIAEQVLLDTGLDGPCPAMKSITNLAANANYRRRRNRPAHPQELDFELLEEHIPEGFLQKDITVNGERHLIFASQEQINLLQRTKTWYLDATFQVVRKPFYQLFSVNAFLRSEDNLKQVPMITCLMSRRRKEDYIAVLKEFSLLVGESRLERIVMDFEEAVWRAAKKVFPDVELKGCAFHFTQAVWRKIQESGLQQAYTMDEGTHKLLRRVMALCMLPAQHIQAVGVDLLEGATTENLSHFSRYFKKTWLESSVWPPTAWSVYGLSIRTNNDLEGWHYRLNKKGKPQMNLYMLIQLLHSEADFVQITHKLLSDKKIKRHQKKQFTTTQGKIQRYWECYDSGELTCKQLLKRCSNIYGPITKLN
jgi:hypothetical protein